VVAVLLRHHSCPKHLDNKSVDVFFFFFKLRMKLKIDRCPGMADLESGEAE